MIQLMFNNPISSHILKQAIADIIKAVAIEKTAFSNILNVVNDILQKAKTDSANLEEYVTINESVNSIMRNSSKVQMMTQINLHRMEALIQKLENLTENDDLEE